MCRFAEEMIDEKEYLAWNAMTVVNQLLDELGMSNIVKNNKLKTVDEYVNIINKIAVNKKRQDVVNLLQTAELC